MKRYELIHGDCMEVMPKLTTDKVGGGQVSLILTDPPYGTMQDITTIDTYTQWDETLPISDMMRNCDRLLRLNGRMLLFCQPPYNIELATNQMGNLPLNHWIYWIKDQPGNILGAKVAPVNVVELVAAYQKRFDSNQKHPLRAYARKLKQYIGLTCKQTETTLGHMKAQHFLYEADNVQFSLCTENTYNELIQHFHIDKMQGYKAYHKLKEIDTRFRQSNPSTFNLNGKKQIKNIFPYKKDKTCYHSTQKPIKLLRELIRIYSNPNDIILDFTMGSGSTGVAALQENRRFIGIEKNQQYYNIATKRIQQANKHHQINKHHNKQTNHTTPK